MNAAKWFILIIFSLGSSWSMGQDSVNVNFNFTFHDKDLLLNQNYYSSVLEDSISFSSLKFYISHPKWNNQKTADENYYLIDLSSPVRTYFRLPSPTNPEFLEFNLGVDSIKNVTGAHGGTLDPMNGMYWSWQSGYINFKLEGTSAASSGRDGEFNFHLGGYSDENNALQRILLPISNDEDKTLEVHFPLELFFEEVDITKLNRVMSPSVQAVELAKTVAEVFKLK